MVLYKEVRDDISLLTDSEVEEMLAMLPEWRKAQINGYRSVSRKREAVIASTMLTNMLKRHFGISILPEFEIGEHGKPSLKGFTDIHFNISHCSKAVCCAVSDAPIGIDIEGLGRYKETLARHCMNDEEISTILSASSPDTEFTRLWTQKEAILKLTGEGITTDMRTVMSSHTNVNVTTELNEDAGFAISIATYK